MSRVRVLRRKKDGWLVIIKVLSPVYRQFGFTKDPEKATEVTDQHVKDLGWDVGERGRFEVVFVEQKCTGAKP